MKKKISYTRFPPKSLFLFYTLNNRNRDIKNKIKISNLFLMQFNFFQIKMRTNNFKFNSYFNIQNKKHLNLVGLYKEVNLNFKYEKILTELKYFSQPDNSCSLHIYEINFYINLTYLINLYKIIIILNIIYIYVTSKKKTNQ